MQLDFIMVSDFFPPTADIIQYCKKILLNHTIIWVDSWSGGSKSGD